MQTRAFDCHGRPIVMLSYTDYIGSYIHYMRSKQQMDAGMICLSCGLTRAQLNNIEQGKCEAHPNTLKKICDQIGVNFVSLFQHQEKYEELLEEMFQALVYIRKEEQKVLMTKMEALNYECSILFPKFLLIRVMYAAINDHPLEEYAFLLRQSSNFLDVLQPRYQFIYHVYQGYYEIKRGHLKEAMASLQTADQLSVLENREILFSMYGRLYYLMHNAVLALDYYTKAYQLFEKKWNINRLLTTQWAMGACYTRMKEYDIAIERLKETLRLAKQYKSETVIAKTHYAMVMNQFLQREYATVIRLGKLAGKDEGQPILLYFMLSYASVRKEAQEDAQKWLKSMDAVEGQNVLIDCLKRYIQSLLDGNEEGTCLENLIKVVEDEDYDVCELYQFLLEDLAELYHQQQRYEDENCCLRKLLQFH